MDSPRKVHLLAYRSAGISGEEQRPSRNFRLSTLRLSLILAPLWLLLWLYKPSELNAVAVASALERLLCGAAGNLIIFSTASSYSTYDLSRAAWIVGDPGNNVSVPARLPSQVKLFQATLGNGANPGSYRHTSTCMPRG